MYKKRAEILSQDILRIGREKKMLYETLVTEREKSKILLGELANENKQNQL